MTNSSSVCPICAATVPSPLLQWHANNHFEDEVPLSADRQQLDAPSWHPEDYQFNDLLLAQDMELAQELALAPPSPTLPETNTLARNAEPADTDTKTTPYGDEDTDLVSRISQLTNFQVRDEFHQIKDGLISMLANCLEAEDDGSTSILSSYVDHFQSIRSVDEGWGCGWRNIQMLSSYLLRDRKEARSVLFGGVGFVPNIASLQRWLEIAWKKGFDINGSDQFDKKIVGSRKWIGTSECAALFRSFGLRARIVSFGPKELKYLHLSVPSTSAGTLLTKIHNGCKRKPDEVLGPMDKFVSKRDTNVLCEGSNRNNISNDIDGDASGCRSSNDLEKIKVEGQQTVFDWIWNYFSDDTDIKSNAPRVSISRKMPLYFQHDGHSRTIVGVQIKPRREGTRNCSLLILDPSHRTADIEKSLNGNRRWQKLIKRGVHTLKKTQYQLCYADPGIANGEELEKLKVLDDAFFDI